ncbi:MAG: Nif3-like dinuclear metal center hexameric protein [Ruminococcaceae bacterium]|nr:Nif3-like dinuclear metal center hexameric protein [Oscillospiraceae bacterium]
MVTIKELLAYFETIAPAALAEEYDNVGLLVEGETEQIETVVLALDADEQTVCDAHSAGAQLIVTHHPVMFRPVNRLTEAEGGTRTLRRLLQKGIGLFAMHTNFDSAEGGLCDVFLDAFGEYSERCSFDGGREGIGRIGTLKAPCALQVLLERARKAYSPEFPLHYVGDDMSTVSRIAVCNGGGSDLLYDAAGLGADVYISGDFKHHHARFAYENKVNLIQIDHYDAEIAFCTLMQKRLGETFGDRLQVLIAKHEHSPWRFF